MAVMRTLAILAFLAAPEVAFGQTPGGGFGPGPVPGGGGGASGNAATSSVALTMNSSAAAAANTTALQAALTAGGTVFVNCPGGGVIYTSGHLTIGSNTDFELGRGCDLFQANGTNDNMLVSSAYLASWTTVWGGSGTPSSAPLSIIWSSTSINGRANSTAYAQQAYVSSNGNLYWQSASACTSGSTTSTAPTGTGSGQADGTCSWNYVTTYSTYLGGTQENVSQYATINYPSHGLSVGQYIWVTPQPDTGTSNGWTGTQTAATRGGPADSAYFGIFPVVAVNDTNYVTVKLRLIPGAQFTGIPLNVKAANDNIKIGGGGMFDYNVAGNSSPATTQKNISIILAGVHHLRMDDLCGQNSGKYFLDLNALADYDVGSVRGCMGWGTSTANGDQIKVYGPAFDGVVHDERGTGWDDVLSFQTEEPSTHYDQVISAGNIVNATARNIQGDGGYTLALYPTNSLLKMQNILLDNVSQSSNWFSTPNSPIKIYGMTGPLNDVTVQNCVDRNPIVPFLGIYPNTSTAVTIDSLKLLNDDVEIANAGGVSIVMSATSNLTINNLLIAHSRFTNTQSGPFGLLGVNNTVTGGTVNLKKVLFDDDYVTGSANSGFLYSAVGTTATGITIGRMDVTNSTITNLATVLSSYMAGGEFSITNSNVSSSFLFRSAGSGQVYRVANDTITTASIVNYTTGAAGATLFSGGGNTLLSGASWFTYGVAANTTVYGWDVACDVTKMNRVTGEFCNNTNAAPGSGTLTTAGLVIDQGTAANSWALLYNPTGQQY